MRTFVSVSRSNGVSEKNPLIGSSKPPCFRTEGGTGEWHWEFRVCIPFALFMFLIFQLLFQSQISIP